MYTASLCSRCVHTECWNLSVILVYRAMFLLMTLCICVRRALTACGDSSAVSWLLYNNASPFMNDFDGYSPESYADEVSPEGALCRLVCAC